jgi:hypothetical protein
VVLWGRRGGEGHRGREAGKVKGGSSPVHPGAIWGFGLRMEGVPRPRLSVLPGAPRSPFTS